MFIFSSIDTARATRSLELDYHRIATRGWHSRRVRRRSKQFDFYAFSRISDLPRCLSLVHGADDCNE